MWFGILDLLGRCSRVASKAGISAVAVVWLNGFALLDNMVGVAR